MPLKAKNRDVLKFFFENHQETLCFHYPGLKFERLVLELENLLKRNGLGFVNESYCPNLSSPLNQLMDQLLEGTPLEYISQRAYFYKSEFLVNSKVLIPRSETESLVELATSFMARKKNWRVCDVGVGSGAILLSLAIEASGQDVEFKGLGIDISSEALEVAKLNHFYLGLRLSDKIQINWKEGDRLYGVRDSFNLIVSNPPYLKKTSKVHPQVYQYEPHTALFLEEDTFYQWYEVFFHQVLSLLTPDGGFFMEGDPETLMDLLLLFKKALSNKKNCAIKIETDLTGRERILSFTQGV